MNVVIYARFSSHSQTEQSIEGQLKACYEYAERNSYTVIGEYIDRALTGTNDNRPEFLRMIEDSRKKTFQGILVYQLDRFARTAIDGVQTVRELFDRGVKVHILNMGLIENTLTGNLILTVMLAFAEYERGMIVERTQVGKALAKQNPNFRDGRPKKFTQEQIGLALGLLRDGKTYREVERMTGISKSTMVRARKIYK